MSNSIGAADVPVACASLSLSLSLVVGVDSLKRLVRPLTLLANPAPLLGPSRGDTLPDGPADSRLETRSSS